MKRLKEEMNREGLHIAVVVSGATLVWAADPKDALSGQFFRLAFVADCCICCRVSPAQKMEVVRLVKFHGPWVTLAIGDGANDVSMIQEAHIGVGIAGKEGAQAVQASDYAISQFRFLQKLVLVHGRWNYRRVSWFICYYFYKNIVAVFTELSFPFFNGFSGQIYFADWLPQLYNSFWTSWPCMFTYIFERDLTAEMSLMHPAAYSAGPRGAYFSFLRFWLWVLQGVFHGLVCFWVPALGLQTPVSSEGRDTGLWWVSTVSFTLVIQVVTAKLFLESVFWSKVNLFAGFLSLLFYYLSVIILNSTGVSLIFQPQINNVFFSVLSTGKFWLIVCITPCFALLPDLFLTTWRSRYRPSPIDFLLSQPASPPPAVKFTQSSIQVSAFHPKD